MTINIKVFVKTRETKDGREFNVYRAEEKDTKNLIAVKFRKTITNLPERTCIMTFDIPDGEHVSDYFNISYKEEYPVLWVSKQPEFNYAENTERKCKQDESLLIKFGG